KLLDIYKNHLSELTGTQATLLSRIIQNKLVNGKFLGVKEFFQKMDTEKQLNDAINVGESNQKLTKKSGIRNVAKGLSY
ncbi:hypothetical protein ABK046_52105, partial [Streptomyces caeruleatus]